MTLSLLRHLSISTPTIFGLNLVVCVFKFVIYVISIKAVFNICVTF